MNTLSTGGLVRNRRQGPLRLMAPLLLAALFFAVSMPGWAASSRAALVLEMAQSYVRSSLELDSQTKVSVSAQTAQQEALLEGCQQPVFALPPSVSRAGGQFRLRLTCANVPSGLLLLANVDKAGQGEQLKLIKSFTFSDAGGTAAARPSSGRGERVVIAGHPVRLVVETPSFSLTGAGRAISHGYEGQSVVVQLANGQRVSGVATATGTVSISP